MTNCARRPARHGKISHAEGARYETADWGDVLILLAALDALVAENQQLRDALELALNFHILGRTPDEETLDQFRAALDGTPKEYPGPGEHPLKGMPPLGGTP